MAPQKQPLVMKTLKEAVLCHKKIIRFLYMKNLEEI